MLSLNLSKTGKIIILIILLATVIRFYDLGRGDVISDESLYIFRSIGYLDFVFAAEQPSTIQLLESVDYAWTKLSFHDHPPLVFLWQHWFIKLFDPDLWAARFLSALLGIVSVYLIYLIGKRLFFEKVGLIAMAIAAVNVLLIYVSRTAVQEAQVVFFILLIIYAFLRAMESNKWYLIWGLVLGLGLLTKYTVVYIVFAIFIYLLIYRRSVFKNKYFYIGILLAILVFSPVVIYNLKLYQNFGHFDFQLSYILGQDVSYWKVAPGKEIGNISDRFFGVFKNLWDYNSWFFNIFALISFISLIFYYWKNKKDQNNYIFLLLIILVNFLFYLVVGPDVRFLVMIVPWLILAIAVFLNRVNESDKLIVKKIGWGLFTILLIWEMVFSINSYILHQPIGKEIFCYSKIHWDMHPWGFNKLDAYLDKIYQNKYPGITIPYNLQFLEKIKDQAIIDMKERYYEPANIITVYNDNIDDLASLWVLNRRSLYQAWPILTIDSYKNLLKEYNEDDLRNIGVTDFYFIQLTDNVLLKTFKKQDSLGYEMEEQLKFNNIKPEIIYNFKNEEIFRVYHYN